jgi:hypothetical protein
MNPRALCATTLVGLGYLGTVLSAQQPTTAGTQRAVAKPPEAITLKGCVAEASGHFLLNRATIVAPPDGPPTAPAAATAASTPAATRSDDHVYELIGAAIKPHIGHQVEVVGTNVAGEKTATPGGADPNDLKRAAHPMTGTVTVTSLKMLSSTCPT